MYIVYNTFSDPGGEICHFDMEYHLSWVYTKVQIWIASYTVFILKARWFSEESGVLLLFGEKTLNKP